jgi:hypothetical protein
VRGGLAHGSDAQVVERMRPDLHPVPLQ